LGGYGDGGMVLTNDFEFDDLIRKRRMYGMINKDEFIMDGINSRLDELQAAILRVKLNHIEEMNAKRVDLAGIYIENLNDEFIRHQIVRDDVQSVFHVFSAVCKLKRDDLVDYLERKGIQSNIYYPMPLSKQKGYISTFSKQPKLPVAESVANRIIALPFYPEIDTKVIYKIVDEINRFSF
jgi:dTDP-4-amino-4,6-dideoxygalactose transaminase